MTDFVSHLDISDEAKAMLVVAGAETMMKARPRWTAADKAILREHYPRGGLAGVRPHLPHKTDGSIHWQARMLGLRAPGYKRQTEEYFTTPHIDEAIRRYYSGTPRRGGVSKLALQMARPPSWVYCRARQLGVILPRKDPLWSPEEIALLRRHAANIPQTISRTFARDGFRRTAGAIAMKLVKLRCDRTDDDHYTGRQLAELMGVKDTVVSGWIAKGWLSAKTRGTTRQHDIFHIHRSAIRRFVIENVGAIDIRRVDKHWLVDLLTSK